jgi:hypothetical protein
MHVHHHVLRKVWIKHIGSVYANSDMFGMKLRRDTTYRFVGTLSSDPEMSIFHVGSDVCEMTHRHLREFDFILGFSASLLLGGFSLRVRI